MSKGIQIIENKINDLKEQIRDFELIILESKGENLILRKIISSLKKERENYQWCLDQLKA